MIKITYRYFTLIILLFIFSSNILVGQSIFRPSRRSLDMLFEAIKNKNIQLVQRIINNNRRVINKSDQDKNTPLLYALKNNAPDIALELVNNGASTAFQDKYGNTAFHIAAAKGYKNLIELMLEKTSPSNRVLVVNSKAETGFTPLHFASYKGNLDIAKILLNVGARCVAQNVEGNTPLYYAALRGHPMLVKFFLQECPKSATIRNNFGYLPAEVATADTKRVFDMAQESEVMSALESLDLELQEVTNVCKSKHKRTRAFQLDI